MIQSLIITQITLQYVDVLMVSLLALICGTVAGILLPRLGYEWCALRRVPAMDVVDESVRICAERGRPLFQSTGGMAMTGTTAEFVEAALSITRYLTRRCGELGVRYISVCLNAQLQLIVLDFARQGYLEAGRPEMFNQHDIRYISGASAASIMEHVDTFRYNKPAAFIGVGMFYSGTPVPIFQEAVNVGAFTIGSGYWPDELAQAAMASDYALMTEEMVICGAYIDNDAEKMSVFIGEDVAKLILLAICIGLGILWLAGVKIFV